MQFMHSSARLSSFVEIGHWDESYNPRSFAQQMLGFLYKIDNKTLASMGERDFREMLPADQAEGLMGRLSSRIMHVLSDEGIRDDVPYLLSDGTVIYADQR